MPVVCWSGSWSLWKNGKTNGGGMDEVWQWSILPADWSHGKAIIAFAMLVNFYMDSSRKQQTIRTLCWFHYVDSTPMIWAQWLEGWRCSWPSQQHSLEHPAPYGDWIFFSHFPFLETYIYRDLSPSVTIKPPTYYLRDFCECSFMLTSIFSTTVQSIPCQSSNIQ
jgi:hypothetical protein